MVVNNRILVVDDDPGVRQAYAASLGRRDDSRVLDRGAALFGGTSAVDRLEHSADAYDLTLVDGGEKALEAVEAALAASAPYAVAFVDMSMPRMDGAQVATAFWERDASLKIVIVTAYSDFTPEDIIQQVGRKDLFYLRKPFNPEEIRQFARALLHQWNLEQEKARVDRELAEARAAELDTAARIQRRLLLGRPPAETGALSISHLAIPSQWVAGDFYDFIPQGDAVMDVIVGDVMGKGVPAALVGAAVKAALLRAMTDERVAQCAKRPSPAAILARVRTALIHQLEAMETFATLCYVRFDTAAQSLTLVDCGHVRPLHVGADGAGPTAMEGSNLPLGFPELGPFQEVTAPFTPGDLLLVYSDGLTEAANAVGELFGEKRLKASIQRHRECSPADLIAAVRRDIESFSGRTDFRDDFSMVAVRAVASAGGI